MAHSLRRMWDDATHTWSTMPKPQALRWYAAVLRNTPTVLRERKLYSADGEMRGNLHFYLFGRTFPVDVDAINSTSSTGYSFLREFFVRQIYFRAFKNLKFDTCLDLGCNTGVVSSFLKQLGGADSRVVGVDALLYPNNAYRERTSQIAGVTFHQGVMCGESVRRDPVALQKLCDRYHFDVDLATTVGEIMDRYGVQHVDFLKMDIEGAEFAIFADATPWLQRVDNLAMEVHKAVGDPSEIIARLHNAGYQVRWLDDAGYPVEQPRAGYIYASRTGALKD